MESDCQNGNLQILMGIPGLMSFRMRMVTAFVVLILCSASATIMIGNTVFSEKVGELAELKAAVDLKIAEQVFSSKLEKLRLLTLAVSGEGGFVNDAIRRLFTEEFPAGTSAFLVDADSVACIFGGIPGSGEESGIESAKRIHVSWIEGTPLGGMMAKVAEKGMPEASVVVFDSSDLNILGRGDTGERELWMLSASPMPGGKFFMAGYVINTDAGIVSYIRNQAYADRKERYASSIFLGNTRISTSLGDDLLGTPADSAVAEAVLRNGNQYVGIADVAGEEYYAAYSPLRDFSGRIVGMLGIGTPERLHNDVRRRTNTLFTSLIGGGMIFGFIMAYVFSSLLMKPVSVLTEGVERVAGGDLNYKVRIKTGDELGRLARSFNKMVLGIKERDMKLREVTEKKLSRVEKQVSIGRLAAGVAHEINNPLTAILTLSSLMLKHMDEDDPLYKDMKIIAEESQRCRGVVRGLLDFARESRPQKEVVDINRVIGDTLVLTSKYDAMEDIELDLELAEYPLYAAVDIRQMQQVFSNILLNAAEAAEGGGGRVIVSSEEDSSGGLVSITFRDNGKGISGDKLESVFEPFYTSKEKGTGLGLSVSLGIVQGHGGTIEIESEPAVGTAVTVIIPRFDKDA